MSIAGIRSNRGDIYQTLVAFDWALTILSDTNFQWLEIDSTTYLVDDVVVGTSEGSVICCQCKKNQTNFSAWSITDLSDELRKAYLTLAGNQQTKVNFYSRSEFGVLAKLREYSTTSNNETDYRANLTTRHSITDADLAARITDQTSGLSTYEFLRRVSFEITPDFDRMEERLRERLREMASNSNAAFNAIWTCLDKLGGRLEDATLSAFSTHRLTKDDLKDILTHAGAMLAPTMSITEVRKSFASTSVVGRSWHRDISGLRIPSSVLSQLLTAIDARKRAVLLTGLPGSGKTCVMLSLQEVLEQRAQTRMDVAPLFIQSREFSDLATAREREAQGLPDKWVEQAARLAESVHVVVVVDSLDVLSIAREHSVLTYFLAQIDQLLAIPNITVITACRDFDRKYDRRIAARQWDCELQCSPLNWETEIAPLLYELGIDSNAFDVTTRELIGNPRELALFVELFQREGSFNVVTSQELSQRYLNTIVLADPELGDVAMRAIEGIAAEMLKSRSLSIPHQRFSASQDILRRLQSLNVLANTHDGKLAFGHQTLLDVLVISGAMRQGISLNEFIRDLPPVPFVRPSVRSFVAQLAMGERREFRKQLRTVLTSDTAFHIRRLIAECFAQQKPQDDDWSLIRDLRDNNREIFQAIYAHATLIEWHRFWLSHLVPALKETCDAEGIIAHVYRAAIWKNEDAAGVLAYWQETLQLDWMNNNRLAEQLSFYISDFKSETLPLVAPLLEHLLSMRQPEHSLLGSALARCVAAGAVDDRLLWRYIVRDVNDEDLTQFRFGEKLHCQPYEFRDKEDNFLAQRMLQSTILLDLALEALENWSQAQAARYPETRIGYRHGFLDSTSYGKVHSRMDIRHVDGGHVLLHAIETAVLDHARRHSDWWVKNRERLCFSHEGAFCYFAVLAFINLPEPNIALIGRVLCDRKLLEFELSFELGSMIQSSFTFLDSATQDAVMATIQAVWEEFETDVGNRYWISKARAEYVYAIPCHLRSNETQSILDDYGKKYGALIRQPTITSWGGRVEAPFSFEVFLNASDEGVINLLIHYSGYSRDFDDSLMGGERHVGLQLREASSRHPERFLRLLKLRWFEISPDFRDDIMGGIADYLAHRHGNLQTNGPWTPVKEADATALANQILDELERHSTHWQLNRSMAKALEACAHVVQDKQDAARMVFLAFGFLKLKEESTVHGNSIDLLTAGINMITGNVAEAMMILACSFHEHRVELPELLPPVLLRLACNEHPAIRALILRRLPYLQSQDAELGWELFYRCMQDPVGLWQTAELCLYYACHNHFEKVAPLLDRIYSEGSGKDMETWGRISALAALSGHLKITHFLDALSTLGATEAWQGAASVWSHPGNIKQNREHCFIGIEAGLKAGSAHATAVARCVEKIFRESAPPISIPLELVQLCFSAFENDSEGKHHRLFGFDEWLNGTAHRNPQAALAATEIYLAYIHQAQPYFYDYENRLVQLITRLFAEAEEREESDNGAMLKRVVSVQDSLLTLGLSSINDWLKAAERQ